MSISLLEAARDLGAGSLTVFRRVILPLSLPGVVSGITMVFVPSVSTFAISRMLGGGTELLLGDLIERQFLGGAYNPQLGAAISLVMMIIVLVCMLVMNRFGLPEGVCIPRTPGRTFGPCSAGRLAAGGHPSLPGAPGVLFPINVLCYDAYGIRISRRCQVWLFPAGYG